MFLKCRVFHVIFLFFSCLLLAGCMGGPVSQARQGSICAESNANPAGTWEGLIQHGLDFVYVRLEIEPQASASASAPPKSYRGRAYLQQFRDYLAGHDIRTDIKADNILFTFNFEPAINSFSIVPGQPDRRGGNQFSALLRNLGGVYDSRDDVLTGMRNRRGYGRAQPNTGDQLFLFTRPEQFKKIRNEFKSFTPNRFGRMGGEFGKLLSLFSGPSDGDIREWVDKYYQSYPGADFYRGTHGRLELQALRLFRDEHFKRFFGEPFDQLSLKEMNGIAFKLETRFKKSRNRSDRSTGVLSRMFWVGNGDNSAKQTAFWTIAQRHYLRWYRAQLQRLATLSDDRGAFTAIGLLEAELNKAGEVLFWPDEIRNNQGQIASARKRVAYPVLEKMIAAWEHKKPDFQLVQQLAEWSRQERELFSHLENQQSQTLLTRRDHKLHSVLTELTQADQRSLQTLGAGLNAIAAGNRWYEDACNRYGAVRTHPLVRELMSQFKEVRRDHIIQATPAMQEKLQLIARDVPVGYAPKNDRLRLNVCSNIHTLKNQWFGLPNDLRVPEAQPVIREIERLGSRVANGLPPNLVAQASFPPASTSAPKAAIAQWKARVPTRIAYAMGNNDRLLLAALDRPVADPGFRFKSQEAWAIFNGRFELLDSRYANRQGFGSDWLSRAMGVNPQFHFAFVSWVALSSKKHGMNQFGPTSSVSWTTTQGDEVVRSGWGKVYISKPLFPFYEQSYKIADGASQADGLMGGKNILEGIFNFVLSFRDGDLFSSSRRRADGEFQAFSAQWEKPILYDINNLLEYWPAKSWGLWQFQENLQRFLEGKKSVQQVYNWS